MPATISATSPGGKSVDAARSVYVWKSAMSLSRLAIVLSNAVEPNPMRTSAGCTSTLSMMAAAVRAGPPLYSRNVSTIWVLQ